MLRGAGGALLQCLQGGPGSSPATARLQTFLRVVPASTGLQPGDVCGLWRLLAKQAFAAGCDAALLVGDDIELVAEDGIEWLEEIASGFRDIR